ncbi:MAG: hypothetical protein NVS4B12_21860 [Ktedonobacteraceae bacterium]
MTNWQDALSEITRCPADLGFGAYHEVGHTVVAKLVGRPITNILLYTNPMGDWGGEANHDEFSDLDLEWVTFDLDRYIPYFTLRLPYLGQPYLWDEHKSHRDFCAIKFAGKAAESLLYEQLTIPESPAPSDEDTDDIRQDRESISSAATTSHLQELCPDACCK